MYIINKKKIRIVIIKTLIMLDFGFTKPYEILITYSGKKKEKIYIPFMHNKKMKRKEILIFLTLS